ncbi:MAG TPA: AAA family ATPase [Ramlibacter sp.]|uniref:trifunctional serine/threonine-protein kinase/ATP-binding protein/sensor histidine kinase n=1 Tax=Ramlibacter sp. TaxID=1917967 RepID=UPI002CC5757C|nr:AAA family ATPase [Ramlibacter sp.]HVZ44938.1 AAA family ATPase [Ramlibacter sp.]
MPLPSQDPASVAFHGTGAKELLYASATTRVSRIQTQPDGARLVCKEYLGPRGPLRLLQEKDVLARLARIEGVVQLAEGTPPDGMLLLRDCGTLTLAHVVRSGKCDLLTVLALAPQLARTLGEIHRAGIIHRDVHPGNIVLSPALQPTFIDFDVAVLSEEHRAGPQDGAMAGTLAYLSPEQTGRTGRPVDQRSDLYALGATLFEMATGRLPFESRDTLELIHDHLVREPTAPSQLDSRVPAGLSAIIMRLLAKEPEQRYQSAEGLLHDLKRLRLELEQGASDLFELGERDFPARLTAPARLVGREAELAMLRAAFADALAAGSRAVLIEGAAGVGKSALVNELRPLVQAAGGWFVHGKFDQYQKERAVTGALIQALRSLGRLLLARPRNESAAYRQRILEGLGRSSGLITRMLPEFELLLGPQPGAPEVDPKHAQPQLQQATADLLAAIASPERPLVIVLDDLHWAGPAPLRVLERLIGETNLRGLLFVAAYRGGESEVLPALLAQWRGLPRPPIEIALPSLGVDGMTELVALMLRLDRLAAVELGRAVHALTSGNPFDTLEMLNALRRDGVLVLAESGWQWDEERVRRFVGRGNVVDLLAARVARLPPPSRELLQLASCLGNPVDCRLLATAAGLREDDLQRHLRDPLADGLLVADRTGGQDSIGFRHDRIQQAVLGTMDEEGRHARQLVMARRLASEPAFEDEAAQQYLACVGRLPDPQEQRRVARLFHAQAQALAAVARFGSAERYLAAADDLLVGLAPGPASPGDAELRAAVDVARHAALYSLGRLDESDPLFASMQARASDPLDLVEPTCLQMRSLSMRGRMGDSLKLGLGLLAQLGLDVPPDFATPDTQQRLDALAEWVRQDSRLDHARRPQVHNRRSLAMAKLMSRAVRAALVFLDTKPLVWLLLESQRLWAEYGPCPELVASLGRLSGMLIAIRNDFRTAYDVARHVLAVGEALGYEPQTGEARFIFASYASHWFEPLEDTVEQCARAYDVVRTRGDAAYACYVHVILTTVLVDTAPTIAISDAEVKAGLSLCERTGNLHAAVQHACVSQLLGALRGRPPSEETPRDPVLDEQAFLARVGRSPYMEVTYTEYRALHAQLLGDVDALARHACALIPLMRVLPGYYVSMRAYFSVALARAWQIQRDSAVDAEAMLAELDFCRGWLARRAADQPANFLHLLLLLDAERAWAVGDVRAAGLAFDAALGEVQSRQRPWQRALITERAGLFQLHQGLTHVGRRLLAEARDVYEAWGASVKVAQMQRDHGFLGAMTAALPVAANRAAGAADSVSADALDLMGVLRASQALSSETSLERLSSRVTEVMAALSGATKVLVLSRNEDRWWLLAPAPGESSISVAQAAERRLLPLSAFAYADRTGEALVVDDAVRDDRFARDPYFAGVPLCSLLVAPISSQGTRRAMLLLESRLGRAAFNSQRLDAVMLIAGQLAVSLANAQLYESLEQRVHARTLELEQAQEQLVATARRAGKAEIANNVLHNVGNVLNSINVSASVVRRTISNSRIEGLMRAVGLLRQHEGDLGRFVLSDPRGQVVVGYMEQAVQALDAERREALADLDRLTSSVEHITYVVATQQSHAGPSSVLETARPEDLLEEALRLCGERIDRSGVMVVRRYDDIPAAALDKQRLLQVLVNLIANAAQAMENMPEPLRRLTLRTALEDVDGAAYLRIGVHDGGEGIAPENLSRIFAHGFTTRKEGHGFGLHSSALAAMEMGGRLTVHSDGLGHGAVFTLELPIKHG